MTVRRGKSRLLGLVLAAMFGAAALVLLLPKDLQTPSEAILLEVQGAEP